MPRTHHKVTQADIDHMLDYREGSGFIAALRDLWKKTAVVVEHPLSGLICVIAIVLWAVLGIVRQFDPSLTYLGAACNALQTFLLFVIAAAQAAHAVDALAHAKAAHAHAQAAHERLDRTEGDAEPQPDEDEGGDDVRKAGPSDILRIYEAYPLPENTTPKDFIETTLVDGAHPLISMNVVAGNAARAAYATELLTIRTSMRFLCAADGLPWYFVVEIPWQDFVEPRTATEILADRVRDAINALDPIPQEFTCPGDPVFTNRPRTSTNTHLSQYETARTGEDFIDTYKSARSSSDDFIDARALLNAIDAHNLGRKTAEHEAQHDGA